ncbi:MAG: alpha/beta fold hydrolase [Desulfuromonadales bacterium]|jgi:pimeloyl-[acyl-carrier protein] methyl ester esterase
MRERNLLFADGRQLRWYEAGQGRPVVLLHGWSTSAAAFGELADLLQDSCHVLIPDLPGHGHSSPAPINDSLGLAAVLAAWLQTVVSGIEVTLVGWSLGGMVALEMAAAGHLPLHRLVLIASTPRFTNAADWPHGLPATQVRALSRNLARRFEATLGEFFALTFAGEKLSPETLRRIRNRAVHNSPLPDRDAASALLKFLATQDQRHLLPRITLPTLVLHGEEDRITPPGAGQALAERLPDSMFIGFAGLGHAPFLSSPQDVAVALREFC